jgi:hypothetical protein
MERNLIELRKILVDLLSPEYVEEGLDILSKCDDKWYNSFYEEINKKSYNTACMAIDFGKNDLVKDGKMIQKDTDNFGGNYF